MTDIILKGKKLNMTQVFSATGQVIPATLIQVESLPEQEIPNGSNILVIGTSKGKGFTGVMKKWNFSGSQATRGQKHHARTPGSIGAQTPSKVFKGKKMAGRHGNYRKTIKGLTLVKVLADIKQVLVSGPVPGHRNAAVTIKVLGN